MRKSIVAVLCLGGLWAGPVTFAAEESPQSFTYQGELTNEQGTAPATEVVAIQVGIYNPAGTCLLYQETQPLIDLSLTSGLFAIQIGSPTGDSKRAVGVDPGLPMAKVFANSGSQIRAPGSPHCAGGYTPASGDIRLLRFTITPQSTGASVTLTPDQVLGSVPQAMVAETLQGLAATSFLQVNSSKQLTQANAEKLTDGSEASLLHNHDDSYAQLETNGSISLSDNATLGLGHSAPNTTGWGSNEAGRTWYDTVSKEIRYWDGTAVKSLGLAGGGVQSLSAGTGISVSGTTNATVAVDVGTSANKIVQLDASAKLPAVDGSALTQLNASNIASGTLSASRLPTASTSTSGALSSTDWNTFNGKQPAGNYLTALTGDVTASGPGSAGATVAKIQGKSVSTTAPSTTGQVLKWNNASTQWEPDTLANILGYTPANGSSYVAKSGDTMSGALGLPSNGLAVGTNQLVVSGGNVGIGTTAPRMALDVSGAIGSAPAVDPGSATIDFASGNLKYSALSCQGFTLNNMKDGASYVLAVQGTSSATCSFTAYSGSGTSGPLTVHMPPGHGATTAGKHTIYNFMVLGTHLYVAWVPGY